MAKSLDIIDPKKELDTDNSAREEEDMVKAAPSHEEGGGGLFYLIIGIVAVIVSTSLALYILFKDDNKSDQKAVVASATATVSPTATASGTASVTTSPIVTTSSTAAAATSTTSTFKYTNEQIRIANGNGISGEGAKIQKLLEGKGYQIASVGNASKQYEASIVYFKTGKEALAESLKKDIASAYTATIEKSDSTVGSYDAVVVLGAK